MPAKWQQWMPLKIDAFRGSPSVQAMHPAARAGYIYLLASAWQTDDCTVPSDENVLSEISGLGEKLWKVYGPKILRKFSSNGHQSLLNHVLYAEWSEAKRVFESRQVAAQRTNTVRWAIGDRSVTDEGANRSADTRTGTVTGTDTKKEQKPSPKPRKRGSEVKHSSDPRHVSCKAEIFAYYQAHNDGEEPDWSGREGRALGMLLGANPKLTADGIKKLLNHRGHSEVNHSERPAVWIGNLKSYRNGPLNQYNKPLTNGTGAHHAGKQAHLGARLEEIEHQESRSGISAGAGSLALEESH